MELVMGAVEVDLFGSRHRLCDKTITQLPSTVDRPRYDRGAVQRGVVHLGAGAFHRGHQAVLFDDALNSGDLRWGVTAVSLRSPAVRDTLTPQDGLYTLQIQDGARESIRCIGAIQEVLVAAEKPELVIDRLSHAETQLVTLTITEKGYCFDPATGRLNTSDPAIAHDIATPGRPSTAVGFVVAGLAARRTSGLPAFTTISCDNLPTNGERLRSAVVHLASLQDPALAEWIAAEAAFPNTMVDRMVPAMAEKDIDRIAALTGLRDLAPIRTEPFFQWVIEDRFSAQRPDFDAFGATLVHSVGAWEQAKLRLLNAAHSAIAYIGGLAGFSFVHEAVRDPAIRQYVEALWDEVATTLEPADDLDIDAYRNALMARFDNPSLRHLTSQIAQDGTQKIPPRLLKSIAARLADGQSIDALSFAVAAWIRWVSRRDTSEARIALIDPLASVITERLADAGLERHPVGAVLSIEAVFPPSLARDERFRAAVTSSFDALGREGPTVALQRFAAQRSDGFVAQTKTIREKML